MRIVTGLVTLKMLWEQRQYGELTLDEFVAAVQEFAEDFGDERLLQAVARFDAEAETDITLAEKNFDKIVALLSDPTVLAGGGDAITLGYPGAISPAQLAGYARPVYSDFSSITAWAEPRLVGKTNIGTPALPNWEERYEMITHTINPGYMNAELQSFKRALKRGAYLTSAVVINAWNVTLQTPTTNYAAVITLVNPAKLSIDWGDGSPVDTSNAGTHTYAAVGTYTIKFSGSMASNGNIQFTPLGANLKATSVIDVAISDFTSTFKGCTGLTSLPSGLLDKCPNATTFLASFNGCTGLTAIPTGLFNNNTQATSFQNAFLGCTGLTAIPSGLFDKCPNVNTFSGLFNGCTGLTAIPTGLFNNNTQNTLFLSTFQGCTGLTAIPSGLFDSNTLVNTFQSTFNGCNKITAIPVGLFNFNTQVTTFLSTFNGCTGLLTIPANLFQFNTLATTFQSTFNACTGLTAMPILFQNLPAATNFSNTFNGCSNITSGIPSTMFSGSLGITTLATCFKGCTKLTGTAPTLWITYASATSTQCFNGCTLLSNYATIPAGWK